MLNVKSTAVQQFAQSFYYTEERAGGPEPQAGSDWQANYAAHAAEHEAMDGQRQQRASQQSHNSSQRSHQTNATSISVRNPASMLASHQRTPNKEQSYKVNNKKLYKQVKNRKTGAHLLLGSNRQAHYDKQRDISQVDRKDEEMFSFDSSQVHASRPEEDSEFADSVARINKQSHGLKMPSGTRDTAMGLDGAHDASAVQKLAPQPFSLGPIQTSKGGVASGAQYSSLEVSNLHNGDCHTVQTDAAESPPYLTKGSRALRDIGEHRHNLDVQQDSFDRYALQKYPLKDGEECSPSWCDSQIKQYPASDFHFEPNSTCKKTAVFQGIKMADYKGSGTLHRNSTASLGQLSRIEKEGSSTYINDAQLRQQAMEGGRMNESELGRILDDSRAHEDIQEFSDLIIQGHAVKVIQVEAPDQNLLDINQKSPKKFNPGEESPSSRVHPDSLVQRNLDATIERFKAYKDSLVHANDNAKPPVIDTKQSHEDLGEGCLYEIQRLEQYSPSVDKLNKDDDFDDDIYQRPPMQMRQSSDEEASNELCPNGPSMRDSKESQLEESIKRELVAQRRKQEQSQPISRRNPTRTGKMKDATTTEFNFTFNQQNNPVQEYANENSKAHIDSDRSETERGSQRAKQELQKRDATSKVVEKNKRNFQKKSNRSEVKPEPVQSGKQSAATEKQNQKRAKNLCKKIHLFSPQQNTRADRQPLKRHDLVYPSQGQSALSDSMQQATEGQRHNMSYDQNAKHSNLMMARPPATAGDFEVPRSSEPKNDSTPNHRLLAPRNANIGLQSRFSPANGRQDSRGGIDQAAYLQKKAQILVSGMVLSTRNQQQLDGHGRLDSEFAQGIDSNLKGYLLDCPQYAQNNYSNMDQMEHRQQELDLSATFEQRQQKLHSEARAGKAKPQTCQNSTTKKMSFSNKSFAHKNNDKFPFKNLAKQHEGHADISEAQKPTPVFYKSSKTKPQIALDIFNELHASAVHGLGAPERRQPSKSQKRINYEMKSQSPEKLRSPISQQQQAYGQKSVRLPSIQQNRQGLNHNGGGTYLPSIILSPNNQYINGQHNDQIGSILSDALSPAHQQQLNPMTGGLPPSHQSSRRIGRRDHTTMIPMENPLPQGAGSASGTPIHGEMRWEGSSPKSKYAHMYAHNEPMHPQHQTPMSQAMPGCPSFSAAEPYKNRYQQNQRVAKGTKLFGNQRNSLRDNQKQNQHLLLPQYSINNSMSNDMAPGATSATYEVQIPTAVQIIEDCQDRGQRARARHLKNKQCANVLGKEADNFESFPTASEADRNMYQGLGVDLGAQKENFQTEHQVPIKRGNYLHLPLSEHSEHASYATQDHKGNQSMVTGDPENLFFAPDDFDHGGQQFIQQSTFQHRHRNILSQAANSQISQTQDRADLRLDKLSYQFDSCSRNMAPASVDQPGKEYHPRAEPQQTSAAPLAQMAKPSAASREQAEGVYIQGHRDIKSSSKLPQAFRIVRTNQHRHASSNQSSKQGMIKHSQQVLNKQIKHALRRQTEARANPADLQGAGPLPVQDRDPS